MPERPTVIGVDIGTESLRAVCFDLQGQVLASANYPYQTFSPSPRFFEQNPADWWIGFRKTIKQCLQNQQVTPESVIGLGFTGTSCTVVPVDKECTPLQNAILWMDTRAHQEAKEITALQHPAVLEASGQVSAEWMAPKALWLKRHEPDIWQQTYKLVEGPDYLIQKLSGQWTAATGSAVGKRHWMPSMGGWPEDLFEKIGMPEFIERNADHVLFPFETAGKLSGEQAQELGLRDGITLVNCGPDAYIATIGSNAFSLGDFSIITGSSNVHMAPLKTRVSLPGMWGPWCGLLQPDQWTLEGGQLSTGSMLRWFIREFAPELISQADKNAYQIMDDQAANINPGAAGLIVLDYWCGNRTPHNDPTATGVIWGLTLNHSRAHVYRAMLEGVAYGTAHTLKKFKQINLDFDFLTACGGGSKSNLWMQIYADVCGLPVRILKNPGASAFGAAISSAVAAGYFQTLTEAADQMVKVVNIIEPQPENTSLYREYLQLYIETYPALRENMHTLSQFTTTNTFTNAHTLIGV